jgi:hypothetical protein
MEPHFEVDRMLIELPKSANCNSEKELPHLNPPKSDNELPNREALRTERVEPMSK